MLRSKRMEPILNIASRNQDEAARVVATREQNLETEERRLSSLRQYVDEYSTVPATPGATLNPALLANRQAFRERLDSAVVQQLDAVDFARSACEKVREKLIEASRNKVVFEKLTTTYRQEEQRVADRREQSVLDDLGARCVRTNERKI